MTIYTGTRRRRPARLQALPMPLPARRGPYADGADAVLAAFTPPPARPRGYRGRRRHEGHGFGAAMLAGAGLMATALAVFASAIEIYAKPGRHLGDVFAVLFGMATQ